MRHPLYFFMALTLSRLRCRRLMHQRLEPNMDLLYLAGIALFFLLLVGFAIGCDRLGGKK